MAGMHVERACGRHLVSTRASPGTLSPVKWRRGVVGNQRPATVRTQVLSRDVPTLADSPLLDELCATAGPLHADSLRMMPAATTAAALLLLAGPTQLDHEFLSASPAAPQHAVVEAARSAHVQPQHQRWQQQQPLHAPALHSSVAVQPLEPTQEQSVQLQQQQQQQQQHQQQQQFSKGVDRPLEMNGETVAALAASMLVAALANSAGVGGGAFIVPLMYLGLHFDIKDSTALSQAVIAGGALGSVACTITQRHPEDPHRPLIDSKLALIITPALLLGCNTGVLLNQMLPSWAVTFLLIPLLGYLTYRTGSSAARLHRCENEAAAAAAALADAAAAAAASATGGLPSSVAVQQQEPCGCEKAEAELLLGPPVAAGLPPAAQPALEPAVAEGCAIPWQHASQLLGMWVVLLGFQLGKGAFSHASWQFAALYGAQGAAALASSAYFIYQAVYVRNDPLPAPQAAPAADEAAGGLAATTALTPCASIDVGQWGPECLAQSAGIALAGGTVAGCLGIGGGMIVGPLMLELGVHPQVSSATASAMVLFSASSAAAAFAMEGRLNTSYAAAFGLSCALAAYVGVELVGRAVRRSGRASLVVWLLTGIVGAGAALTIVYSGSDAVAELLASLPSGP